MGKPELRQVVSNEMKLEKDIPFVSKQSYPFASMEVGDSFLVVPDRLRSTRVLASLFGQGSGRKFTVRKTPEGHRCWRIA